MVEHPGMWDQARALFRVGTVVGVVRKITVTVGVRGKHRARRRLGKRLDYRKGANNQTRAKGRSRWAFCGEGACSRSGAQRPPRGWGATQPSGSKLPRHNSA
ncbi:hypothetical protein C3E98_008750 [Pseudomonas sp. MWU13-2625]|nr:hypothetical protein C3E98_008750 [Pseudomonas sp. MWU13-2625]